MGMNLETQGENESDSEGDLKVGEHHDDGDSVNELIKVQWRVWVFEKKIDQLKE